MKRFYCDANIFIMAVEGRTDRIGAAGALIEAAMNETCTVVTSLLTLGEALVVPLRFSQDATIESYRALLGGSLPGIRVLGIDSGTMEAAARLRARYPRLKLPDAIHLATAEIAETAWFVTNDLRLPAVAGMKQVTPFDDSFADLVDRLSETP